MKTTREELIDFKKWCDEHTTKALSEGIRLAIENYIKSINSEAGNETTTVTDNEGKKEDFYRMKYEKCIKVINRFDPGIIGMYDL